MIGVLFRSQQTRPRKRSRKDACRVKPTPSGTVVFLERHTVPLFLFLGKTLQRKDEKRMRKKSSLSTSVSILLVAVIAITALIRGNLQLWLNGIALLIWTAWAVPKYLIPFIKERKAQREAVKVERILRKRAEKEKAFTFPDVSDPVGTVLLRHANHRVSSYLKAIYPDATWKWRCEKPEKIIAKGGTARIEVFNVTDFNFAELTFDQNANIEYSMLKVVPLAISRNADVSDEMPVVQPTEINPQVWYEKQGKNVLQNIITDLNSRGHNSLTINENGSISIKQADRDISQPAFTNLPGKEYWNRLAKVFERDGIATDIQDTGLVLTW